jgi:hypothetical protein
LVTYGERRNAKRVAVGKHEREKFFKALVLNGTEILN